MVPVLLRYYNPLRRGTITHTIVIQREYTNSAAQEITGNKQITPAETKHMAPAKNFSLHVEWTAVPDTKNQGLKTYTSIRKCYSLPYSDNLYRFKPSVCL